MPHHVVLQNVDMENVTDIAGNVSEVQTSEPFIAPYGSKNCDTWPDSQGSALLSSHTAEMM